MTATGIESHAGLAPEAGASAVHALAEFVTATPDAGTTVNVGLINGGTGVTGRATATIDIHVRTQQEKDRVDAELKAIKTSDPRVRIDITHGWSRPPTTLNAASARLLDLARAVAQDHGHDLRDAAGAADPVGDLDPQPAVNLRSGQSLSRTWSTTRCPHTPVAWTTAHT